MAKRRMSSKPKAKGLTTLADKTRGPAKEMTVRPVPNGKGGMSFVSETKHKRHPSAEKQMMSGGGYVPEPEPVEAAHDDRQAFVDHFNRVFPSGGGDEPDGDESPDGGEQQE